MHLGMNTDTVMYVPHGWKKGGVWLYLSKIFLDPMHPSVRQALRDRQDLHRNLLRAFPENDEKESILFRIGSHRSADDGVFNSRWLR